MEDKPLPVSPTLHRHRRQFVWQILVPILLAAALVIALAVFTALGGPPQTGLWRDISLIWMLFPALFLALGLLTVLAALIYGLGRLHRAAPRYTGQAQDMFARAAVLFRGLADKIARPFIAVKQVLAAARSIFKR